MNDQDNKVELQIFDDILRFKFKLPLISFDLTPEMAMELAEVLIKESLKIIEKRN